MNFVGSRWFKCDFHLHTIASECFQDKAVTPAQFVQKAKSVGLDCIAITDHNTPLGIDAIKTAAIDQNLTVFPGVEITCDTSKIHLLVLFDTTKTETDVSDFLVKCDIQRASFGKQDAHTSKNIFDIVEIAKTQNGIVIPAHIDDFNGLGPISQPNYEKLFALETINAVQITHKEFWSSSSSLKGLKEIKELITSSGNQEPPELNSWHSILKRAIDERMAFLSFSDNPHSPGNPKHGLDGIGQQYTWLKMESIPTLEGLRQAFLLPEFRVRNCYFCPDHPYRFPDFWLKSISIFGTSVTEESSPLSIDFSPQLTTIIGGRGSGKSGILRFLRGVFGKTSDISSLEDVLKDHNNFYKRPDGKSKLGVLSDQSKIVVTLVRNSVEYRISVFNIQNSATQKRRIESFNPTTNAWQEISEVGFLDLFEFEQFSQKQIYEIAQEPNSLRERIDKAIDGLESIQKEKETNRRAFLEKSTSIRTIQQQISGKGKLQTEIKDLDDQIKIFQQSGIADLLISREKFIAQEKELLSYYNGFEEKERLLESLINEMALKTAVLTSFSPEHAIEMSAIINTAIASMNSIISEIKKQKEAVSLVKSAFSDSVKKSNWLTACNANKTEFQQKKEDLEKQGINDIANFEALTNKKAAKEKELQQILVIEAKLSSEILARQSLSDHFLGKCKEITMKRRAFVSSLTHGERVKIKINPFRNRMDFVQKIRAIIQRETEYEKDVEALSQLCFKGNVEDTIKSAREVFLKIRRQEFVDSVSGHFVNLVLKLADSQIDEIELLLPEDEIEVQYQPTGSTAFKHLSAASAGQKTTAILTFILSHGNNPLILDQPEDDLDNRLVYELIVDRLKNTKEQRQVIVVTHNANIPVNGDAEYIVSMDSESKKIRVLCTGTVELANIKKEICDVMEGSEFAFQMRAKRYQDIR
ncbi:MAG: PHP domain-containing protein [Candidatus Riflebacteria bacterium]|nr:PHP domain-containing protein [Candidatus Riflebacteria bacterium]